ncbi:MAG: DnaJ domain-containing protein [Lewinellaceae bacterium]|nr:DnaJ domain-containing protein [Lewinellaceae bacterium]
MLMNYFEFYGLPVSFQIDAAALRRIFYQNSKKYHPDFHTLSDDVQQSEMLEKATWNNEAYQTLSDPDRRMLHLLQIKGLWEDAGKQSIPQDFLIDMMDINEALMDLEIDFDPERFAKAVQGVENIEKELNQGIRPILENYTEETGSNRDLQAVLEFFLKKKYLLRIHENLSKFAPR